ncbi:MAG TPA: hypothetical protein VHI52_15645, partial [Verrucomicrobiae bacterium]|nr:hypothetical protein [Verrucomicrobiae bacterium]
MVEPPASVLRCAAQRQLWPTSTLPFGGVLNVDPVSTGACNVQFPIEHVPLVSQTCDPTVHVPGDPGVYTFDVVQLSGVAGDQQDVPPGVAPEQSCARVVTCGVVSQVQVDMSVTGASGAQPG